MKDKPLIKIEIDNLRSKIAEKMEADNSDFGKRVESEIEEQIITYDFTHKIAREINNQVTVIVNEYFKFGEGYKIVKEAIELSLNTMFRREQ